MFDSDKTVPHQAAIEKIVNDLVGGGGGSSAGSPIVRKFPFAFDTPNLFTGHTVYTPEADDILLDAWFEIETAWDGVTPLGDVGVFLGGNIFGLFEGPASPVDMTLADQEQPNGFRRNIFNVSGNPGTDLAALGIAGNPITYSRAFGKLLTNAPLKVVVSQNGSIIGPDPGSTQGSAILYLVTCTPI